MMQLPIRLVRSRWFSAVILYTALFTSAFAGDVQVMTYNTLNYGEDLTLDGPRESYFRLVIDSLAPDLLIVEEVHGTDGFEHFRDNILNWGDPHRYTGSWLLQTNTSANQNIGVFFRTDSFAVLSKQLVEVTDGWGLRDVFEVKLRHVASAVEFYVYGAHLKASSTTDDKAQRALETAALRSYLDQHPTGTPFIVAGDLNLYTNSEPAWSNLTGVGLDPDGQVHDPINREGSWHDSPAYADVHTQSPRSSAGGIDDRFDFILLSTAIMEDSDINFRSGSYYAYGNDGQHLNAGITEGENTAVSPAMAEALYIASDHLPVICTLQFGSQSPDSSADSLLVHISEFADAGGTGNYIYEFVEIHNRSTRWGDLNGAKLLQENSAREFVFSQSALIPPLGMLVLGRDASSEAFQAYWDVQFDSTVVYIDAMNAFPVINGDEVFRLVDGGNLNIDPPAAGEYSLTSVLEAGRVIRVELGNQVDSWLRAHDSTATPGSLDPGQPTGELVSVQPRVTIQPRRALIRGVFPNPFNPIVRIELNPPTDRSGSGRAMIYDIQGQHVVDLWSGAMRDIPTTLEWTGRDQTGHLQPSGIYLMVIRTPVNRETVRVSLLR